MAIPLTPGRGLDNPIIPQGTQKLNAQVFKYLTTLDLQGTSKFDFLVFRTPFGSPVTQASSSAIQGLQGAASIVGVGMDIMVAKAYVTDISFGMNKWQLKRVNGDQFVEDIEYVDTINVKYIDDQRGLVMRYLQSWNQDIAVPASVMNTKKGYIFRDNQEGARRTGMLLLANSRGKFPPTYPRITFYGMFPRAIEDITVAYDRKENLTYDVQFAVRDIRVTTTI